MKKYLSIILFLFCATASFAQRTVYIPRFITSTGMDLNNTSSQWCYARSTQTDNIIVFWEAGFGADPSTASGTYRVDMKALLDVAQKSYTTYLDSLKFAIKGSSVTDKHKLMIFLLYQTEWAAYGSGQDELVGTLHVDPAAARINNVLAHEIGHCFEYIAGCDNKQGGWRYGFGANGAGGNGFWEQCAQWMAFKTYPAQQFTVGDFQEYTRNNHKHIIHETPRYANYFVQDYWTYKRGKDFMGRLWRLSIRPEDPIEAYKRLNSVTQEQFNDEMYEHASRLTTWDLPAIKSYGANYIDARPQVKMNQNSDKYWTVDPSVCIENYGYNSIKLNAPTTQSNVVVRFRGKAGEAGFRSLNMAKGGWRYGFVALLKDGTRVYSNMGTAKVTNGANPAEQTLSFTCPANCSKLWLVVSGSPQEHWKHAWDDDDSNDEHWPYQVQFGNTNILGQPNGVIVTGPTYTLTTKTVGSGSVSPASGSFDQGSTQTLTATPASGFLFTGWTGYATGTTNPLNVTMSANKTITATFTAIPVQTITYNVEMLPNTDYTPTSVALNSAQIAQFFGITTAQITSNFGTTIKYFGISNGTLDSVSTANAPGHWFDNKGNITTFGASPYLYSELNMTNLTANVGQSPNVAKVGDVLTFKQALVYTKSASDIKQITLVFNVSIKSVITGLDESAGLVSASISPNPSNESFKVELTRPSDIDIISLDGQQILTFKNVSSATFGENLKAGVYIVKAGNSFYKIVKE